MLSNTESAARQYALKQRAISLGWHPERITVIDSDQGQSGASAGDRAGFQRLVAEVSLGHAGIVLGLEVSRLARNSADWGRLVELCALTSTAIADEDGIYDPSDFNDQLLLGLKGTMSAAELHLIRARLIGGQRSKARRGELKVPLPAGLTYDPHDRVRLDPDQGVQSAVRLLFTTFAARGSARAVVQHFKQENLTFPIRHRSGPHKGSLGWAPLTHSRVLQVLHNCLGSQLGRNRFGRFVGVSFLAHAASGVAPWGAWASAIMASSSALAALAQVCQAGRVDALPLT